MKYQRLKSIDGSGTIMRYYELADDVAYANAFYKIANGEATKIVGTVSGAALIGFSHGGNNLAEGLIFLDINPNVVYMGILGDEDTGRPAIGELVNGFQRVIDTHYDGDEGVSGKGTDPEEWGIERLTNPYYLFTIEQPEATAFSGSIDDEEAGEVSGVNPNEKKKPDIKPGEAELIARNLGLDANVTVTATPVSGEVETYTIAEGSIQKLALKVERGKAISTVYSSIVGKFPDKEDIIVDVSTVIHMDEVADIFDFTNNNVDTGYHSVLLENNGTVDGELRYTLPGNSDIYTFNVVAGGAYYLVNIPENSSLSDTYHTLSFTPNGGEAINLLSSTPITENTVLYVVNN